MSAVINIVLPVFAIMASGYLCGRLGILGEGSSQALNGYVFYVALPALFFLAISRVPVDQVINLPFLAAFGGGILAVFGFSVLLATFLFPNRLGALALHGMSTIFSNTGYMGIPLLLLAFGEAGRLPAVISSVVTGAVVMGLVTAILEVDLHAGSGFFRIVGKVLVGVFRSPLIIAVLLGAVASALELEVPVALVTFCEMLGVTAGPAALFAIGLFMVGKKLRQGLGEVIWICLLKLIAQPLITWWLAYEVLRLDPVWAASAVILSALPTGALTFVLAQRYEIYIQRATSVILISTVLSLATLSVLFLFIEVQ